MVNKVRIQSHSLSHNTTSFFRDRYQNVIKSTPSTRIATIPSVIPSHHPMENREGCWLKRCYKFYFSKKYHCGMFGRKTLSFKYSYPNICLVWFSLSIIASCLNEIFSFFNNYFKFLFVFVMFGMVSFFYGISTFVKCLMSKTPF